MNTSEDKFERKVLHSNGINDDDSHLWTVAVNAALREKTILESVKSADMSAEETNPALFIAVTAFRDKPMIAVPDCTTTKDAYTILNEQHASEPLEYNYSLLNSFRNMKQRQGENMRDNIRMVEKKL